MIRIAIDENGQLNQPQPDGAIAIVNNGLEAIYYFSEEELPENLKPIVNPEVEEPLINE